MSRLGEIKSCVLKSITGQWFTYLFTVYDEGYIKVTQIMTKAWAISSRNCDFKVAVDKWYMINRGSYKSAYVLLNLLNELGKRDKMWGLPSILSLFFNEFNKFNNTRAQLFLLILFIIWQKLWNLISGVKKTRYNFVIMYVTLLWTS